MASFPCHNPIIMCMSSTKSCDCGHIQLETKKVLPNKLWHLFNNHHHLLLVSATWPPPPHFDAHSSKANDIMANDQWHHKDENNNNNNNGNNNNDNSKNSEDDCYGIELVSVTQMFGVPPFFFIFYLFIYF